VSEANSYSPVSERAAITDTYHYATNAIFGELTRLLYATPRRDFRLASIHDWLLPPVQLGQCVEFRNNYGHAFGYATWAFLSDEVLSEFMAAGPRPLHISEWNEGLHAWVMDFVCLDRRMLFQCVRDLRNRFRSLGNISGWREGKAKSAYRCWSLLPYDLRQHIRSSVAA
jgi:hemolysin-activating ACP:hemolysin acyltransferase